VVAVRLPAADSGMDFDVAKLALTGGAYYGFPEIRAAAVIRAAGINNFQRLALGIGQLSLPLHLSLPVFHYLAFGNTWAATFFSSQLSAITLLSFTFAYLYTIYTLACMNCLFFILRIIITI
jgi:hypothetical protein